MIGDDIQKQINEAMKAGDEVTLTTLRLLASALHNAEIDKKRQELTEEDELAVVKREVKKRKDAIEIYEKAKDTEKAGPKLQREKLELKILEEFLPEEMSDEELGKMVGDLIKEMGAQGLGDMGKVMGVVMGKLKGQASGDRVVKIVKENLIG